MIGWLRELFYLTRLSFKELIVMGVIVAAVWGLRFLLRKSCEQILYVEGKQELKWNIH